MKKKLFKELVKSIKQAGEIKRNMKIHNPETAKKMQRCNDCYAVFDEELTACPNCGRYECARAHEEQFPGEPCWPHTQEWINGEQNG